MVCGLFLSMIAFLANEDALTRTARAALDDLPGQCGFLLSEIGADGPVVLAGFEVDTRFAVGSTFKLYLFGALVDDVNRDRRKAEDVARLRADWIGPPASELADWPLDSPVTLHTLALKMISISDNTATDHLLHILGRERVESQMVAMGHAKPEWNRPLLSTREMTMLRNKRTGLPAKAYMEMDAAGKRRYLSEHFTGPPDYETLDFDTSAYSLAEWYATPMDMARALTWIQKNTQESDAGKALLGILSVETKLAHDRQEWPYVGFKGGSEDQLICGNWLLRHRNGKWYTMHIDVNSPDENVPVEAFVKASETIFHAVSAFLDSQ